MKEGEPSPLRRLKRSLLEPASLSHRAPEERLRYQHFTIFFLLGVPTLLGYGLLDLRRGDPALVGVLGAAALGLTLGWLFLRRTGAWRPIYRVNIVIFSVVVLYVLAVGGEGGAMSVWTFTIPLITLLHLGRGEGVVWATLVFVGVVVVMSGAGHVEGIYPYSTPFKARFVTAYLIVSALSFWFEHSRHGFRKGLEERNRRLEAEMRDRKRAEAEKESLIVELQGALDEVKALSGLLPICSHCHRIRDDQGYWNRLEKFIQDRSDAQFSHGICPECLDQHFPEDSRPDAESGA